MAAIAGIGIYNGENYNSLARARIERIVRNGEGGDSKNKVIVRVGEVVDPLSLDSLVSPLGPRGSHEVAIEVEDSKSGNTGVRAVKVKDNRGRLLVVSIPDLNITPQPPELGGGVDCDASAKNILGAN